MRPQLSGFLVVLGLVAITSQPLAAQRSRQTVMAQLNGIVSTVGSEGYSVDRSVLSSGSLVGVLRKSGLVMFEMELRAGTEYLVVGGCDEDCDDLDLQVRNGEQDKVTEDIEEDDTPVLTFTANESGPHLLTVNMASCTTDVCYFGVRVFRK